MHQQIVINLDEGVFGVELRSLLLPEFWRIQGEEAFLPEVGIIF